MSPHIVSRTRRRTESARKRRTTGAAFESLQVASSGQRSQKIRQIRLNKLPQLIGEAILDSAKTKLPVTTIYERLSEMEPERYQPTKTSWKGNVRRCPSLHFEKTDGDEDNPSLGKCWRIREGEESIFLNVRSTKNAASRHKYVIPSQSEISSPTTVPTQEPTQSPLALCGLNLSASEVASSKPEYVSLKMISPNLDVVAQGNDLSLALRSSNERNRSSPSTGRNSLRMDSQFRYHRDVSTVVGPSELQTHLKRLSSPAGPPRGRAEEEIARMLDSGPQKVSAHPITACGLKSSSSPRQPREPQTKTQFTQAERVNCVFWPPSSISSSTTLRRREEMTHRGLQSTLSRVSTIGGNSISLSPPLNVKHAENTADDPGFRWPVFHVFQDHTLMDDPLRLDFESMVPSSSGKPSFKQVPLEETPTTIALSDITNSAAKEPAVSTSPIKAKAYSQSHPETPSKVFAKLDSSFELSPCRGSFSGDFSGVLSHSGYND
ncbi:forkhead box protein L2 [Metarhizium guizhouense ARSEF 977]|uniref:Forkhead box protein L2 n=1 Tax=Metarhizium guizhouense (strain ARSEF 977) TaxID=1276136 RepID=A0A0B4GVL9_METGA|nr:forkhead box protein L2 [Metarhizium guizhouense ARSEF 977]